VGLCPSNQRNEGMKGFPTLGDPPFPEACRDLAVTELRTAGFPRGSEIMTVCEREVYKEDSELAKLASAGIHMPSIAKPDDIEWITLYDVDAKLYGWTFRRAWYYWVASTGEYSEYTIPEDVATKFNQAFRQEARVQGYAGGQDVRQKVNLYHVDTPRGLAALIELLKKQYETIRREQLAQARGRCTCGKLYGEEG